MRQRDAVIPFLFTIVLENASRRTKVKTRGNIFDRCIHIMTCVDDAVVIGIRLQDVKEVFTSLVKKNNKIGLEINEKRQIYDSK